MASAVHQYPWPESGLGEQLQARRHDPLSFLGRHAEGQYCVVRAYLPHAEIARIGEQGPWLSRVAGTDLFEWQGNTAQVPARYRLHWANKQGGWASTWDPYCFPPQIPDYDLHLFNQGRHWHIYRLLGANAWQCDGVAGTLFAVWAPNADRVSVVGDFNGWDGRVHPMQVRGSSGVWELFIPETPANEVYKYEIRNRHTGQVALKADPYARRFESPPRTASLTSGSETYAWQDQSWMAARRNHDWLHAPLSVYEVHAGSWRRHPDGREYSYRELAEYLVPYVRDLGFTHVELMPVMEHPFGGSWGYQVIGNYAATSRYGSPDDFRYLVDQLHQAGLGVILDWVPAHFPSDDHALAQFDGSALYEHEDPRRGKHPDWDTLIYDYGRAEVRNYLLASALYWLEEFHADGLRVDAVASMLYLDYSRKPGEWLPNSHGGRENLEAIDFLRELNRVVHEQHPGVVVIAEESTAWPQVTRPTHLGGLGFSMKWNMGWMHDTLGYLRKDPIHRLYHHDKLTFGLLYNFSENFLLPLSHDEVVHGKGSLLNKMPGDDWQRFANLRLLMAYQWTYPGKKLLFMGGEIAQAREWDHDRELDWHLLQHASHAGMQKLVADLAQLYRKLPALHRGDFDAGGFQWLDCHDATQSVLSFLRCDGDEHVIVVLNFTPVPRTNYRIGVPTAGDYQEILNTDSSFYGGSNIGNLGRRPTDAVAWMGQEQSLNLNLPPLGAVILRNY